MVIHSFYKLAQKDELFLTNILYYDIQDKKLQSI